MEDKKINELVELIGAQVSHHEPYDTYSFLIGFQAACDLFCVFKNGERYLGTGEVTVWEVRQAIKKYCLPEHQE